MNRGRLLIVATAAALAAGVGLLAARGRAPEPRPGDDGRITAAALARVMEKIEPLQTKLGKPKPGEWLAQHKEPGQTFEQYRRSRPLVPDRTRRTICVQPLGEFTKTQRKVIDQTADVIGRYYNLPVRTLQPLPLSLVPAKARRVHPTWGDKQVLTTHVLDELLARRLPKDAFAYIAFTTSDLWPGRGWNFVFGQASLRGRVGVWSMYRYGDPHKGAAACRLCLKRTIQTATHELGHMFSMYHCTAYECNMCGSNSLPESDRRPMTACPECLAKICWATQTDPVKRYRRLHAFYRANGFKEAAGRYARLLKALGAKPAPATRSRPAEAALERT